MRIVSFRTGGVIAESFAVRDDLTEEEALTMQKRRGTHKAKSSSQQDGMGSVPWRLWHILGAGTAEPLQWERRQGQGVWEIWKRSPFWFDSIFFSSVKKKTGHQLGVRNGMVV